MPGLASERSLIYLPLFLELKRFLHDQRYGRLTGGDIAVAVPSPADRGAALRFIHWLTGGRTAWDLIVVPGRDVTVSGVFSVEGGTFRFSSGEPGSRAPVPLLEFRPKGEGDYVPFPLAEGDADRYAALDVAESAVAGRESLIYPARLERDAAAWAASVLGTAP